MTCKPHDNETRTGGFCFNALLDQVLGTKFDESCLKCFAAAGHKVDNTTRRELTARGRHE